MTTEQSTTLREAIAAARETWRPPPRISVADWAGRYRHLSMEASAEPGLWCNARAPHLVLPMNCLSPYNPAERVVCKFSSQTGKTEIILNFCGFIIDCDPGPILAIQPNVTPMGEAFSKTRIAPMLRDSPTLAGKAGKFRSRDSASTITHKTFPKGHLSIAGANSPAGLASRPIRYLVCDELDRWEATKEGDPLALARKRQQTFRVRRSAKELIVSSPTYDDVGICIEYAKCQQQYEWHLKCLHCGESQFPKLSHFHYNENPESVRYICEHCGSGHTLDQADRVKATGHWVSKRDDGEKSVGFWMNQWASPFARWDDTIGEWLDAGNDTLKRQAVTNTAFAEAWEGEGDRIDPHVLEQRAEAYSAQVPQDVQVITIGVDIQIDRLELEAVGWGSREISYSIAYEVLPGEPSDDQVWIDLRDFWRRRWKHESGTEMNPIAMCIDSGNWAKQVYAFVATQKDRRIIPIKGASAFGADPLSGSKQDRKRRMVKRMHDGRPPEVLGVSQIKRIISRYLAAPMGSTGYCHFPKGRGHEYYNQLTGERLVVEKKRGRRAQYVWKKIHADVEALDCRVYAYAGLLLADPDLNKALPSPKPTPKTRPPQQQQEESWIRGKYDQNKSWVNRK